MLVQKHRSQSRDRILTKGALYSSRVISVCVFIFVIYNIYNICHNNAKSSTLFRLRTAYRILKTGSIFLYKVLEVMGEFPSRPQSDRSGFLDWKAD